jgi:hypothetical protein
VHLWQVLLQVVPDYSTNGEKNIGTPTLTLIFKSMPASTKAWAAATVPLNATFKSINIRFDMVELLPCVQQFLVAYFVDLHLPLQQQGLLWTQHDLLELHNVMHYSPKHLLRLRLLFEKLIPKRDSFQIISLQISVIFFDFD